MYLMRTSYLKVLGIVACFSCYASIATATVAGKGLVCLDEKQFAARFSDVEPPLLSLVAHWFDDKRVTTTTWSRANDHIAMSTIRRGVPYQTNVKTVSWKPDPNEKERNINRPTDSKTISHSWGRNFVNCGLQNF